MGCKSLLGLIFHEDSGVAGGLLALCRSALLRAGLHPNTRKARVLETPGPAAQGIIFSGPIRHD